MSHELRADYQRYYAEKLWELIPAVYRHEDGLGDKRGVLRALIEMIAQQAALLRKSNDRLWDDQFIELCDDWAVPYIGDLVGTRLISALNARARRIDVAKTIYYRRRKGTLRILEELISDITDWEGTVVENFRRLGRTRHGLDPEPLPFAGRFTGTLPGGWADLRNPRGSDLSGGPFEEFHYSADTRRHRGGDGRYGIPKLAFYLFRLQAYRAERITPYAWTDKKRFSVDPSGRDIQLFMPRNRPQDAEPDERRLQNWDSWRLSREWELPAPMQCRVLNHAEYEISENLIQHLRDHHNLSASAADELRSLRDIRFSSEMFLQTMLKNLSHSSDIHDPAIYNTLLDGALLEDCGKKSLVGDATRVKAIFVEEAPGVIVLPDQIVAGNLMNWDNAVKDKRLIIDPVLGRILFIGGPPVGPVIVTYHYGFSGNVSAGTYDRQQFLSGPPDIIRTREKRKIRKPDGGYQIEDITAGSDQRSLTALDFKNEGIIQLSDSSTYTSIDNVLEVNKLTIQSASGKRPYLQLETNWVLDTGNQENAELVIEGVWIGNGGGRNVILRGDYEKVLIRHSTLDPGGKATDRKQLEPVVLSIEGHVKHLIIDHCITGPIHIGNKGVIESCEVSDSIIQSINDEVTLFLSSGETAMNRVTVFGTMSVHRLRASEILVTGNIDVEDTQQGCFRFSAAPKTSRIPRPYHSVGITEWKHYFTSCRFGDPGYAQLSEAAPEDILRGAENGSEIGAFCSLINPIKLDGLRTKIEEYMPFGLIPLFIKET